jgi:hypothetical protein
VDLPHALRYDATTCGWEVAVETPEPEPESENPPLSLDPMALLAALLNATGLLRVHKRPRRKRP